MGVLDNGTVLSCTKCFQVTGDAIMSDYRDLKVWHKSRQVTRQVYLLCQYLPDYEKFGLRSQMQRAAVSISSNITEGSERYHYKEFIHFLEFAKASSSELENQLILCKDLNFFTYEQIKPTLELNSEVRQMINGLIRYLRQRIMAEGDS